MFLAQDLSPLPTRSSVHDRGRQEKALCRVVGS